MNREQYEGLHYLLSIHRVDYKKIYNGYLGSVKVWSEYWEKNDKVDVREHTMMCLYGINTSCVLIDFEEDTLERLLSEDFNLVVNELILNTLRTFNIEDYYRDVVAMNIEEHNDSGYLENHEVHELIMEDGEFFSEIEFYINKLFKNKD